MWQPHTALELHHHLPGGVAPSRYDLALDAHLREREEQQALIREAAAPARALMALRSALAKFFAAIARVFTAIPRLFRVKALGQPRPSFP